MLQSGSTAVVVMLWLSALLPAMAIGAAPASRPNVIVILSDDQGWGDLSVNGNTNLRTPHIDSLAANGAMFDRFYVCPVCSPTRAEFLTGRYHARGGVFNVSTGGERLDLDERTIGDVFKAAGYQTAAFGKWHNGSQYPYHPNGRGFTEYYGFTSGHWGDYFSPPLEHNGEIVRGDGFIIDDLTNRTLRFIEQNKSQPFFCYVPLNTPHSPMQVPDEFYERFKNAELPLRTDSRQKEDLDFTRAALAMCENIDWNVGRILKQLDDLQLADNTIVAYFCDNGPNSFRWNGGMKGRKGSTDEGGVRSPLLVRWPGKIPAGTKVERIAGAIDLLPTFADLAGVPVPTDRTLDGVSQAAWLKGERRDTPDRMIFSHWNNKVSVRTQTHRLDADGKLFDMVADPGQHRDVRTEQPELAARLSTAVADWRKTVLAELKREDRPYTVGYRQFPLTNLPARDGVPHGNVKRSAGATNCSYFTNWKTADDRITWDIAVAEAGKFDVVVYYAVAAENVGATIELSVGDRRLVAKLETPNDPPALGAEHDRASRGSESFVKDFKPWTMGRLELPAGRGTLSLRALEVPGREVMEVRQVQLNRLD
ncbi:MAG: arylsulfatase [Planctomycetaceae bacterium]|nr:arylsulfatase [Planctomycetaceae bacterium]